MFDLCIGILLACMALYGAVQVIQSIWLQLTIAVSVLTIIVTAGWLLVQRFRRY